MSRRPTAIPHRGFMSRLVASFQTQDDMPISNPKGATAISVSTQHLQMAPDEHVEYRGKVHTSDCSRRRCEPDYRSRCKPQPDGQTHPHARPAEGGKEQSQFPEPQSENAFDSTPPQLNKRRMNPERDKNLSSRPIYPPQLASDSGEPQVRKWARDRISAGMATAALPAGPSRCRVHKRLVPTPNAVHRDFISNQRRFLFADHQNCK
jgi:hypothetical protein